MLWQGFFEVTPNNAIHAGTGMNYSRTRNEHQGGNSSVQELWYGLDDNAAFMSQLTISRLLVIRFPDMLLLYNYFGLLHVHLVTVYAHHIVTSQGQFRPETFTIFKIFRLLVEFQSLSLTLPKRTVQRDLIGNVAIHNSK